MASRRLFLTRLAAHGVRASMLAGVAVLVASGRADDALGLALAFPATLLSSLRRVPAAADLAFTTVVAAFMWGTPFGLLTLEPDADTIAHGVGCGCAVFVVACLLRTSGGRAALVVALLAVGWEGVEWLADATAGTNFQPSRTDTLSDLAAGVAGALLAALAPSMIASLRQLVRRVAGPAKARVDSP